MADDDIIRVFGETDKIEGQKQVVQTNLNKLKSIRRALQEMADLEERLGIYVDRSAIFRLVEPETRSSKIA